MITIILKMLGWLVLIFANVAYDAGRIKSEKGVNHVVETVVRIAVGLFYAAFVFQVKKPDVWFQDVAIFMATSFYLFFELFLNLSIGKEPFYLGNTSKHDIFFRKNRPYYYGLKLFTLVLFIYGVINVFKHGQA